MPLSNFERMLQLADEVFASKTDSNQIDVNEGVLDHLRRIHPATVSAHEEEGGPVAWVLVIPTTQDLMNRFLTCEISERELYERTPLDVKYDALYLCSAMVLEEYRRKGLAKKLTLEAIDEIRKDHPIQSLFVWTFSREGMLAAKSLANSVGLPLKERKGH
jgi:ribosomal protein S18 acetylase RimI-like enzyme